MSMSLCHGKGHGLTLCMSRQEREGLTVRRRTGVGRRSIHEMRYVVCRGAGSNQGACGGLWW